MTREEAIANLNMISVAFVEPVTKEQRKIIDDTFGMAINALEQESCEDVISREPFTDSTICEGFSCDECSFNRKDKGGCILEERVMNLPSAKQKPKTIQEIQAESEKYQKAFEDGYEQGYAQARFDYEQEPCEDAISRQYLIEKATNWEKHFHDSERYVSLTDIQNAPPINPQESVLEKIRAEIKQLPIYGAKFLNGYFTVHVDVDEVLQIIDKYRGEVDCRECKAEHDCYECEKYSESEES